MNTFATFGDTKYPVQLVAAGPRQHSRDHIFVLSSLLRVLKWGPVFHGRRESDCYWSLPFYRGVTPLVVILNHSLSLSAKL
jgi:hypothetical protein